jgi:hypothetical protein
MLDLPSGRVERTALIDANSLYVSCERAFDPKLEGKPVVVLVYDWTVFALIVVPARDSPDPAVVELWVCRLRRLRSVRRVPTGIRPAVTMRCRQGNQLQHSCWGSAAVAASYDGGVPRGLQDIRFTGELVR